MLFSGTSTDSSLKDGLVYKATSLTVTSISFESFINSAGRGVEVFDSLDDTTFSISAVFM